MPPSTALVCHPAGDEQSASGDAGAKARIQIDMSAKRQESFDGTSSVKDFPFPVLWFKEGINTISVKPPFFPTLCRCES